jgi:hypothetical protein
MRAYTVMLGIAVAIFTSSLSVQAQAPQSCDVKCLGERIVKLEEQVANLTTQLNSIKPLVDSSIKSGQDIKLEMPTGCLTYVGPSGDKGGVVSWSRNCISGTNWTIKNP